MWQKSVATCSKGSSSGGVDIGGSFGCDGAFSLHCLHWDLVRRTDASRLGQKNRCLAFDSILFVPWWAAWSPSKTIFRSGDGISILWSLNDSWSPPQTRSVVFLLHSIAGAIANSGLKFTLNFSSISPNFVIAPFLTIFVTIYVVTLCTYISIYITYILIYIEHWNFLVFSHYHLTLHFIMKSLVLIFI